MDDGNLFSALEEVDRLGDIDMEPMDLLGSDNTDNFDLFAEIEKYETSGRGPSVDVSRERWDNSPPVSSLSPPQPPPSAPGPPLQQPCSKLLTSGCVQLTKENSLRLSYSISVPASML